MMEDWRGLKTHPAADVLPLMTVGELVTLRESIRSGYDANQPIVLHDGCIVDGRNRHGVCVELGVEPAFVDYQGDPADIGRFVLNRNVVTWRALNQTQKALAHLQMRPYLREELREQGRAAQADAGRSGVLGGRGRKNPYPQSGDKGSRKERRYSEAIAKEIGVGRGTVERAVFIHERDEEMGRRVVAGKVSAMDALKKLGYVDNTNGMAGPAPKKKKVKRPKELALEGWELIIEAKLEAFLDVAQALFEIREKCLYTEHHGQFNRYLKDRWGIPFAKGRQVMCAIDALSMSQRRGDGYE